MQETGLPPLCPSRGALREHQYLSVAAIMGLMGAFFWAIRGTSGYGGSEGGMLAGLGWAVLWYGFANLDGQGRYRPYASPRIVAAITFGIAFGGLTGYGVYTAWVDGKFYLDYPDGMRAIAPWTGYAMLFLCGLHWGGVAGVFMAWCAPAKSMRLVDWMLRVAAGIAGAVMAGWIVRTFPHWFLPFYNEGVYDIPANETCLRAQGSIGNIASHLGLFLGFLCFEAVRRDWRAVGVMTVMALGFAVPFALGGYWHTFREAGTQIDWWKNWEMSIGLGGGLAFGLAFYRFNRPVSRGKTLDISARELVWGGGLPLWLGCCLVFAGACKEFSDMHHLYWPDRVYGTSLLLYVLLAGAFFIWRAVRVMRGDHGGILSFRVLAIASALIVAAGYVVSTPLPLQFSRKVLLCLYVFYTGVSLLLFLMMRRRMKQAGSMHDGEKKIELQ